MNSFVGQLVSLLLLILVIPCAHGEELTSPENIVTTGSFQTDPVFRLAFSLGRATGEISPEAAPRIFSGLTSNPPTIHPDFAETWQKLLRVAQTVTRLKSMPNYFPVGYEFETANENRHATHEFTGGAKVIQGLIEGTFGSGKMRITRAGEKGPEAEMKDGSGRLWKIVTEWVHFMEDYRGGWETVTPPLKKQEDLLPLATFVWKLGKTDYGTDTPMTGMHQTFDLVPQGETVDSKRVGLVATNFLLLHEQFLPSIFDTLGVVRWDGIENMFFRPILFDHPELLEDLKSANPKNIDLTKVKALFFDKYIDKETQVQAKTYFSPGDPEIRETLRASKEEKGKFVPNWKYRDVKFRFNTDNPQRSSVEARFADYTPELPEGVLKETLLYQLLLKKANDLAKEGKIWKLKVPYREPGEKILSYWKRLKSAPGTDIDSFIKALDIQEEDVIGLLKGTKFKTTVPPLVAGNNISYGFEFEGWTSKLVNVLVPRDPDLRKKWKRMNQDQRVAAMAKLGFEFDGHYSLDKLRILTTEFEVDTIRFPFIDPELFLEASGNWEVKSHGRGVQEVPQVKSDMLRMAKAIDRNGVFAHVHQVVPEHIIDELRESGKLAKFTDYLERLEFYLNVHDYATADSKQPDHALDSWSLDRSSEKDLRQVLEYLKNSRPMGNKDQKYHSIAFRPVLGGVDLENREVGNGIQKGLKLIESMHQAVVTGDFGENYHKDPPLFMEFRDSGRKSDTQRYEFENAVNGKYKLSARQRSILHKLQFEIYKPSMGDFMYFGNHLGLSETPDAQLDSKFARTNFESNVALPLQNYESQSFVDSKLLKKIISEREKFIDGLYNLVLEIEANSKYEFILKNRDFLHLCDFLQRSTHPSRPDFSIRTTESSKQQEELEKLTYRIRALASRFARNTELDEALLASLNSAQEVEFTLSLGTLGSLGAANSKRSARCLGSLDRLGR